ncbi:MAG TPA: hypothetical protein VGO68_14975 [Pyrinomonadaceae bacterium]|jgi:hypothetical protein|nr:hypothetical protein [Pyrinomonadaceae bacterium]
MILSTFISNRLTPAGSFTVESPEQQPLGSSTVPDHASCRLELDRVVHEIQSHEVREIIETVFRDLLRLLESLGLIEKFLRQVNAAEETFALFQIIHDEARSLVDYIREDGLNCSALNEEVIDTLDGIAFAINHDLQRVFEFEQSRASAPQTDHLVVGKLYRAHDLLTNCLQQSTITLAIMFDPNLVGAKLFNNSDIRYRQSLQLCVDLSTLLQQVEACEDDFNVSSLPNLLNGIERFRNETLECLNYADWPQFESFCETINVAGTAWLQLEPVLHQFHCYIETLLSQVKMRAVLAKVFPVLIGDDNVADAENQQSAWDPFAVAV